MNNDTSKMSLGKKEPTKTTDWNGAIKELGRKDQEEENGTSKVKWELFKTEKWWTVKSNLERSNNKWTKLFTGPDSKDVIYDFWEDCHYVVG